MGMRNSRRQMRQAWLRAPLPLLGVAGVLWSLAALPSFWRVMPARELSTRILIDGRFKPGVLSTVLAGIEEQPDPILLPHEIARAEALVRVRIAEEAIETKSSEDVDRGTASAVEKVRSSLSSSPADPFLWLMLYSMETARNGLDLNNVNYLVQSYATAPREGWIALRRNKMALAIFPGLSEAMQTKVVSEFATMVDAGFIEDAATNLTTVGWPHRDRLLTSLAQVDIGARKSLVTRLVADGVKVSVANVDIDGRLWR